MKTIGVLSDTHLKGPSLELDAVVGRHLTEVDLLVHAGDMVHLSVLDSLYATGKEVIAVSGNMDPPAVQQAFPLKRTLAVEGLSLGIIHGWGPPAGIRARIREAFAGVDAIIYGHTHAPFCGTEGGVFFFNPGSVCDSRFTSARTLGIIVIDGKDIRGEIRKI